MDEAFLLARSARAGCAPDRPDARHHLVLPAVRLVRTGARRAIKIIADARIAFNMMRAMGSAATIAPCIAGRNEAAHRAGARMVIVMVAPCVAGRDSATDGTGAAVMIVVIATTVARRGLNGRTGGEKCADKSDSRGKAYKGLAHDSLLSGGISRLLRF